MTSPHTLPPPTPYDRGLALLQRLEGREPPSLVEALGDVAPDLARLAIGFVYGEVLARPQLALPQRQLVTVAALAAMGHARPQLKFHIAGALNAGCSSQEIVELMIHLVVYAGFPAGLNGMFAAQEVFTERGVPHRPAPPAGAGAAAADRYRAGWEALCRIDGSAGTQVVASLSGVAPDLGRFIVEFAFGDVYTRGGLDLLQRELATVAMLSALGHAAPQLRVHAHGLLNVGGTPEQLVEVVIQVAAYAGFPAALNAMRVVQDVLAERASTSAA
ncbi:carboxymuconolactone decarboxylase family protein [Aquincola sp. J276]|uniref:carboxymuconolactone decarboxylase family protein n=1 Tax=Aquincola sp. J276 TaxID=2898432 RepID=UPI0021516397|nr:carboxymuconolactone decarboxylase family protein [Aquincola sp. J276]MCR5865043.1 carboxymuconolactone decarboxylase family protein [Aquincola sp. J276]